MNSQIYTDLTKILFKITVIHRLYKRIISFDITYVGYLSSIIMKFIHFYLYKMVYVSRIG
jgi:hypothetical protein